jgi:hypothetical protein
MRSFIISMIKFRVIKLAEHVAQNREEMRTGYKILIRKPEEVSPLAKPRHAWEDNIKIDLKETENILTGRLSS